MAIWLLEFSYGLFVFGQNIFVIDMLSLRRFAIMIQMIVLFVFILTFLFAISIYKHYHANNLKNKVFRAQGKFIISIFYVFYVLFAVYIIAMIMRILFDIWPQMASVTMTYRIYELLSYALPVALCLVCLGFATLLNAAAYATWQEGNKPDTIDLLYIENYDEKQAMDKKLKKSEDWLYVDWSRSRRERSDEN